jgi:hypothetical protein
VVGMATTEITTGCTSRRAAPLMPP